MIITAIRPTVRTFTNEDSEVTYRKCVIFGQDGTAANHWLPIDDDDLKLLLQRVASDDHEVVMSDEWDARSKKRKAIAITVDTNVFWSRDEIDETFSV